MGTLKTTLDIMWLILGLAITADSTSFLMTFVKERAVKEAHPQKYISLKQWTQTLHNGK